MADDFEIIPEKEISNLKKEIQKVKENPFGDNESSGKFLKTVDNLNDSMNNMLNLFKIAADSMQNEEKEEVFLADKIKPISEKVDRLLEQNEKIAKALVAIADMIEEIKTQKKSNPLDDLRSSGPVPPAVPPYQQPFGVRPLYPGSSIPPISPSVAQMPPSSFGQAPDFGKAPSFGQQPFGQSPYGQPPVQNSQSNIPPMGGPSPFLEDDTSLTQGLQNQGLPSFSDFSDKKMNMPPPPSGFGGFNPSPSGAPAGAPKKGGLFGRK